MNEFILVGTKISILSRKGIFLILIMIKNRTELKNKLIEIFQKFKFNPVKDVDESVHQHCTQFLQMLKLSMLQSKSHLSRLF